MDLNTVKSKLELAFSNDDHEIQIEHEVVSQNLDDTVVQVTVPNPGEETAYVAAILESYGFVPVPELRRNSEVASLGGLQYTNDPEVIESQYDGDADVEMASALDDEDEAAEVANLFGGAATINASGDLTINAAGTVSFTGGRVKLGTKGETARSLDAVSDESLLKVLGNPDMMKTANKLYDMIAPGEDKSTYAAFLYNFDDFLLMHKPALGDYDEGPEDDEEDDLDVPVAGIEGASAPDYNKLVKLFGDFETASLFVSTMEIAKKKKEKNGRSAVLSHLMKGMSGEHGIDAINAFDKKDKGAFEAAMSKVVSSMSAQLADAPKGDEE